MESGLGVPRVRGQKMLYDLGVVGEDEGKITSGWWCVEHVGVVGWWCWLLSV